MQLPLQVKLGAPPQPGVPVRRRATRAVLGRPRDLKLCLLPRVVCAHRRPPVWDPQPLATAGAEAHCPDDRVTAHLQQHRSLQAHRNLGRADTAVRDEYLVAGCDARSRLEEHLIVAAHQLRVYPEATFETVRAVREGGTAAAWLGFPDSIDATVAQRMQVRLHRQRSHRSLALNDCAVILGDELTGQELSRDIKAEARAIIEWQPGLLDVDAVAYHGYLRRPAHGPAEAHGQRRFQRRILSEPRAL